jgi:arylsulfatase A-like enzyme
VVAGLIVAAILLLSGGLAPTGAAAGEGSATAADPRPNVIVIMTDDQDAASLSVMPNVRRLLAEQGTTYTTSLVGYPLCCPSRATYLTGQYPHNHGVLDNKAPDGGYYRLRGDETLPVWLSRAGYQTAHIGKYLNGYGTRDALEVPPGWGEWYGSVDPTTYRMWGYTLNENGQLRTYGEANVEDPALYQTDVYAAKAIDYVHRKAPGDAPFFLSLAPLAAHTEGAAAATGDRNPRPAPRHHGAFADAALPRPPSFNEPDVSDKPAHIQALPRLGPAAIARITKDYRSRLESLLAVDEAVAAIIQALQATGELDNTMIVFTSDNGWMLGEHRIPRGKIHPYGESAGVPLILRGPGIAAGAKVAAPVANIDLAPTILAAAQAPAGITVDGRSLLQPPPADRAVLVVSGPRSSGRWYAAVRTARYLYVEHSTGEQELYDLATDPYQRWSRHAAPSYAEVREALAVQLRQLRTCAGATC